MIQSKWIPLCSALLVCGLAFGQTPPTPPSPTQRVAEHISTLTQVLSLNSEQQTHATTIFTDEAKTEEGLHTSLQAAHQALQTAIDSNDTASIATAAEKLGQLSGQQIQAHATAEAAFRALLNPDQLTKYKALHGHGPHGPGFGPGFGGPPPGPPGA